MIVSISDLLSPLGMAFSDQVYEGDFTIGDQIVSINDLLSPLGMAFSDQVYEGDFTLGDHDSKYQ